MSSAGHTLVETFCPICKKSTDSEKDKEFPFCSERCRLTDLGNWASEKYKVTEPATDESGAGALPGTPAANQNNEHEK